MPETAAVATHPQPVWRDRSDFIIRARVDGPDDARTEQLWARQLGIHTFELCCIPFFIYDLALGDTVETDSTYLLQRVLERSGRYVFRAWFEGPQPYDWAVDALAALGCSYEWSSPHLLAVDAADQRHAQLVADCLAEHERSGELTFETGRR
jgi:hypothetical protein